MPGTNPTLGQQQFLTVIYALPNMKKLSGLEYLLSQANVTKEIFRQSYILAQSY